MQDIIIHSNHTLQADDSNILSETYSVSDCLNIPNDLLNLSEWVPTWQMQNNLNKCELFALRYNNPYFPYNLGDFTVNSHVCCRNLVIHMSNDLYFTLHCSKIARLHNFRRRQFQQTFARIYRNIHKFWFSTHIRHILESNSMIWSPRI